MKRLGFVCLLLLFSSLGVVSGDVPRHVDPAQYELVEPDPDVLFMLYHNMFEGMISENITVQEEWLQMIGEFYTVDELASMLEDYHGQITVEATNLNLTRQQLDLAVKYISEYNISAARSSFFTGLRYLAASNETIPILRGQTNNLGISLDSDPSILLADLDQLEVLIDDYREIAQLYADFLGGEKLVETEIDKIKENFKDVVDEDLFGFLEKYLDEFTSGINPNELEKTSLSMDLNTSSAWVGQRVRVSGWLSSDGNGLGDREILVKLGEVSYVVSTGDSGYYLVDIELPYLYEDRVEIRGFYWPNGVDVEVYSPATVAREIELLYIEPVLELDYLDTALPGRLWNVSGVLSYSGVGLEDLHIHVRGFGKTAYLITGADGEFSYPFRVPLDHPENITRIAVTSGSGGVYSGVSDEALIQVVRLPLVFDVSESGVLFSGFPALFTYSVTGDGYELGRCRVTVVGEDGSSVDYSKEGSGLVQVFVPLWRATGSYNVRLVADPYEPWIKGATVMRSFYVVNSVLALFMGLGAIVAGLYLKHYFDTRKPDTRIEMPVPVVAPVEAPLAPPVFVHGGFSGLFLAALRVVERLTGVVMLPSDTLREYLARITDRVGDRVGGLFRELVLRYERWLYGRPYEPDLQQVEALVASMEKDDET
jgi:hypothetical protein